MRERLRIDYYEGVGVSVGGAGRDWGCCERSCNGLERVEWVWKWYNGWRKVLVGMVGFKVQLRSGVLVHIG